MPQTSSSSAPILSSSILSPSIMVVAVLYQCEVSRSSSISSVLRILDENSGLAQNFSLVLYDNSPQPQAAPAAVFPVHYFHDAANGGLASAYNYALARAEAQGCEWLLLLDQDTSLTSAFLCELAEAAAHLRLATEVAAMVPKLKVNGVVHSPAIPFLEQMRRQFLATKPPIGDAMSGVWPQPLCAYNSGSTLRVSALRAVGGFPAEFWLDFLDHAVFAALLQRGYRIYVMVAALAHDASYADIGSLPLWRMQNVLAAQTLFVQKNGNFLDRLLYRIWLLRHSRNLREACKDPRVWREAVRQALLFRVPTFARPHGPPPLGQR